MMYLVRIRVGYFCWFKAMRLTTCRFARRIVEGSDAAQLGGIPATACVCY